MIQYFSKLVRPLMVDDDGEATSFFWAGSESYAACLNPNTGRLHGTLWNGGDGDFYPTVYVSPLTALRIGSQEPIIKLTLRGFPRCALELTRITGFSMTDAQTSFETILGDLRIIR